MGMSLTEMTPRSLKAVVGYGGGVWLLPRQQADSWGGGGSHL